MTEVQASRTLVKSPPELWAECSDAAALARHLGGFGEIRITRLDPETAVAWEGERVRGTVRIEPAGWGTKVVLTAEQLVEEPAPAEPVEVAVEVAPEAPVEAVVELAPQAAVEAEPRVAVEAEPRPQRRRWRLFARLRRPERVAESPPEREAIEPAHEPEAIESPHNPEPAVAEPTPPGPGEAALAAALDSLGQAHHRPFSRG